MSEVHDIAVLGADPAGSVAAGLLARQGLRVVLVDCPADPCHCPLGDWVPKEFWDLAGLGDHAQKASRAAPFRTVRYHDAKLARQTEVALRPSAGSFLRHEQLSAALLDAARKAGAKVCRLPQRPLVRLGEESVLLTGAGDVTARMLLISHGSPHEAAAQLSLTGRSAGRGSFTAAALEAPLPAPQARKNLEGVLSVAACRQRGKLGLFFAQAGVLHARLIWSAGEGAAPAAELTAFLAGLQEEGLLPRELDLKAARGAVWRPPAGEALDLETHSTKRCLLLGTAGGFADSISGQTLYPSVRSASAACRAAVAALQSKDPQEELLRYKNEWRKLLAGSLRPPSTSVDMLVPLLMSNQKLAQKFTRALLLGEGI